MVETPEEIAVFFHSSFAENYFTTAPLTVIVKNGAPQPLTLKRTGSGAYAMIEVEKKLFSAWGPCICFRRFEICIFKKIALAFFFHIFLLERRNTSSLNLSTRKNGDKILSDSFVSMLSPGPLILSAGLTT